MREEGRFNRAQTEEEWEKEERKWERKERRREDKWEKGKRKGRKKWEQKAGPTRLNTGQTKLEESKNGKEEEDRDEQIRMRLFYIVGSMKYSFYTVVFIYFFN